FAAFTAFAAFGPLLRRTRGGVGSALAGVAGVGLHFARRAFLEADTLLLLGPRRADGFLVKADGLQDLLPPGQWHGLVFAARRAGSAITAIRTTVTPVAVA